MKTRAAAATISLFACALFAFSAQAKDKDKDAEFFQTVEGQWVGPGEIVAGKYKGTKFTCTLDGSTPDETAGMTLDGNCRVGIFNQPMKATIARSGGIAGDRVVLNITRKQLTGAMLAKFTGDNTLNVTISVRLEDTLIPVVGMTLKRVDNTAVSSIAKN